MPQEDPQKMHQEFQDEDAAEGQDHSHDPRRQEFEQLWGGEGAGSAGSTEPTTGTTSAEPTGSTTGTGD
jgi:hypothetical protein